MIYLRKKKIMPNWCENSLSIAGKLDDLMEILNAMNVKFDENNHINDDFEILQTLYPTPQELLDTGASFRSPENEEKASQLENNIKKYGSKDWYDWRIKHWGTKWGESDLRIQQELHTNDRNISSIAFGFDTAWAPPIEAFTKICADYPKLVFSLYYEEPGMGFCGKNVWADGEMQEEEAADLVSDYFDESDLYDQYISKTSDVSENN